MNLLGLVGISCGLPAIILISIGIFSLVKEYGLKTKCTSIVKGKVKRYTFWSNNGVAFPIVEYTVNGANYTQQLRYSYVKSTSKPLNSVKTEIASDINDAMLKINKNSWVGSYPLEEKFPIGSEIDVYYNPNNPKQSFVLRYAKSLTGSIFLFSGIFLIILGIVIYIIVS